MAPLKLQQKVFDDFRPRLEQALVANDDLALYDIIPEIQKYFNNSHHFMDEANAFMGTVAQTTDIAKFQANISEATQRMEASAQKTFLEKMSVCNDEQKMRMIRMLGEPNTDLKCAILNFERIPELQQERITAGIDETSSVLILGTGSISVSGLYFASYGARVTLLDRDPRAIEKFKPVYDLLPKEIRDRISFEIACDARDYQYPQHVTHICLAALLEPKEPIIEKIYSTYMGYEQPLTLLVRTPRKDLMQFFYYDVKKESLEGFKSVGKVDIGYEEQPANTFVLKL